MAATSDFAKTSCFTYLTSPILAALRGGQAYEVPLHRLSAKKHNEANVSQILGIKNRTKNYTQVPDIATKWYACHLKQLQNAMQRECTKEAAAREKACANFFKAQNMTDRHQLLLAQHNALPICGHESNNELNERTRGGDARRQRNAGNFQLEDIKKNTKYMSPEFEELWLQHMQRKPNTNRIYDSSPPISLDDTNRSKQAPKKTVKVCLPKQKRKKSCNRQTEHCSIVEHKKRIIIKKCLKDNTRNLVKVTAKKTQIKKEGKLKTVFKIPEFAKNSLSTVEKEDTESIKTLVPQNSN